MLSAVPYAEPGDELEAGLAAMWRELLETERVGIDDDFFELGGHSLKAAVLAANVQRQYQTELPLRQLFRTPTIRGLAAWLREADRSGYGVIRPVPERASYPASAAQQRMYIMQQSDPSSTAYHVPLLLRLRGELDEERLADAFDRLTARHESLRTAFGLSEGQVVQFIAQSGGAAIERDRSSVFGCTPEEALERLQDWLDLPFDLGQPPFRVRIARLAEEDHLLLINLHHIITDGVSTHVLVEQFEALYNGEQLPAPALQYKDYASWQEERLASPETATRLAYWQRQLGGYAGALRFPAGSGEDGVFVGQIDPALSDELRRLARQSDMTPFMVLLAAYQILLGKHAGASDVAVATPVAGRPHAELQAMVGLFVNTVVIRNSPLGSKPLAAYLAEVRAACLEAFEHQDVPFDWLARTLPGPAPEGRQPLLQTMFVMQNTDIRPPALRGLRAEGLSQARIAAKADLALQAFDSENGGYTLRLEYRGGAIARDAAERMVGRYVKLLRELASHPERTIDALQLLEESELAAIAAVANANRQLTDTFDF